MPPLRFAFSVALLFSSTASAQLIPWSEPPAVAAAEPAPREPAPRVVPAKKFPLTRAATATADLPLALPATASALDDSLWNLLTPPATLILSSFAPTDPGAVRAGTSWVGQVTQNATTLTVAGTAADDNGWGATGLSLNASPYTYLNITAQRDADNATPTLFFQFEDRSSRTKVISVSTALFAVGTPTTVQIPLAAWTVDFGANDITAWSIGGGSVGTVPFRMTFDDLTFSASAIPEPATYAAMFGAVSLLLAWRRRVVRLNALVLRHRSVRH